MCYYCGFGNFVTGGEQKQGIDIKYDLKLTNGHSFWTKHFSADEFGWYTKFQITIYLLSLT